MRITKVYTRTGDRGTTRLATGRALPKDDVRIRAYGTVDETNAAIGVVRTFHLRDLPPGPDTLGLMLKQIQNDLFEVGAELATPPPAADSPREAPVRDWDPAVTRLEGWIDTLNDALPPLREFILPGGGPVGAFFHVARTTCRRAEREVVTLLRAEPDTGEGTLRYLNRLSDWLFVAGRWAARAHEEAEYQWERSPAG